MVILSLFASAVQSALSGEEAYWPATECVAPPGAVLEVGGLLPLGPGELLACTRRGEIWRIEDAWSGSPRFSLWCDGLQEPLGLVARDGWVWTVQRGEVTKIRDRDGDGRADDFEVFCDAWPTSGDYHEYAFGPAFDREGNVWVTLNRPFGAQAFGPVPWRGWAMRIAPDGTMTPACAGLRSPAGIGVAPWGTVFYTDNQGEWCGASKLSVLREGDFHGHPWGIESCRLPESRVEHPGELPDGVLMPEAAKTIPNFRLPAVWFPYDVMGRSPSGFAWDEAGAFGPFAGQLFVGDQYQASVIRVFLEQVDGVWQGTCFPFRRGLVSGVIRVAFDAEGGLVVGMSDRGWAALGTKSWGLQRLAWSGEVPFEIRAVRALPGGFELEFTRAADPATLADPRSYAWSSWTYELHSAYGSEPFETRALRVTAARPSADGQRVEVDVEGLREGYVHALAAHGVRDAAGAPLLHAEAYATLLRIPAR